HDGGLAASAGRGAVDVPAGVPEYALPTEVLDDDVLDLGRREPRELLAVVGKHPARLVDRREHGQAVDARELEILGAGARRDVDDARALIERNLVPRDHAVLDAVLSRQVVERPAVAPA